MAFQLYPYQKYFKDEFFKSVDEGMKHICCGLVTGGGKTAISSSIIRDYLEQNQTCIFIVPRLTLLNQTKEAFDFLEKDYGKIQIIQGGRKFDQKKLLFIASLKTIVRRKIEQVNPTLIVIDEAHIGHGCKDQKLLKEKFPTAIFLYLTATPHDAYGHDFEGFDRIIKYKTKKFYIENGYLSSMESYIPMVPNLSNVSTVGGDYNIGDLDRELNNSFIVGNIVASTKKLIQYRKTLVFCVTIKHTQLMAQEFRDAGFIAQEYHSKMKTDDREKKLQDFKDSKIQILISVSSLNEGVNVKDVECLLIARPTKSASLWVQIVGRGLRSSPGKQSCLLLDCGGCIDFLGLPDSEVKPRPKKPTKDFLCKSCNEPMQVYSKVVQKQDDCTIEKTEYICKNGHHYTKTRIINPPKCDECNYVFESSHTEFKDEEDRYIIISTCPKCGYQKNIREIPKINAEEMVKIESNTKTTTELITSIKSNTPKKIEKDIKNYVNHIMNRLDESNQKYVISDLYKNILITDNLNDIKTRMKSSITDTCFQTHNFDGIGATLLSDSINHCLSASQNFSIRTASDTVLEYIWNLVSIYNSWSKNSMAKSFVVKVINYYRKLLIDHPKVKSYICKSVNTRLKNIIQKNHKVASIMYFADFIRENEEKEI